MRRIWVDMQPRSGSGSKLGRDRRSGVGFVSRMWRKKWDQGCGRSKPRGQGLEMPRDRAGLAMGLRDRGWSRSQGMGYGSESVFDWMHNPARKLFFANRTKTVCILKKRQCVFLGVSRTFLPNRFFDLFEGSGWFRRTLACRGPADYKRNCTFQAWPSPAHGTAWAWP